jgi:hypothetical protein
MTSPNSLEETLEKLDLKDDLPAVPLQTKRQDSSELTDDIIATYGEEVLDNDSQPLEHQHHPAIGI